MNHDQRHVTFLPVAFRLEWGRLTHAMGFGAFLPRQSLIRIAPMLPSQNALRGMRPLSGRMANTEMLCACAVDNGIITLTSRKVMCQCERGHDEPQKTTWCGSVMPSRTGWFGKGERYARVGAEESGQGTYGLASRVQRSVSDSILPRKAA